MKIFATSDIHGNKTIINKLVESYENSEADILLICGDIGGKSYHSPTIYGWSVKSHFKNSFVNLHKNNIGNHSQILIKEFSPVGF